MNTDLKEILNEKTAETADSGKGRELNARNSTFCLPEGSYKGTITGAFWYKTTTDRKRVMLVIQLEDGTEFKSSVDDAWIDKYPFSRLISQANVKYVEDFVGLKVLFDIRNTEGDTMIFSNIRKISLDADV